MFQACGEEIFGYETAARRYTLCPTFQGLENDGGQIEVSSFKRRAGSAAEKTDIGGISSVLRVLFKE